MVKIMSYMISEILYIWMMRNNGSCIFNDWFILFDGLLLFLFYFCLFGEFLGGWNSRSRDGYLKMGVYCEGWAKFN